MKLDLGKIITRSWEIIWNYKVLWIFGIFAGFASSNGGSSNSGGGNSSSSGNPSDFTGGSEQIFGEISNFLQEYLLIIIAICLVLVLLSFAFYALGMMGRIGILKGVYKLEDGASSLLFAELWSESMPYFWRFFGLNFLVGMVMFLLVMIILIPAFVLGIATAGIAMLCILPFLCLLIPIGWVVNVVLEQAQAAIVAEDLTVFESIQRGWEIAKSDIGGMIALSLILGIGGALIGGLFALPLILALVPLFIGFMGNFQPGDALPVTVWISIICCGAYLPILIGLNGVLTAYIKTAWALSYKQLTALLQNNNTPLIIQADA